jgi:phage N-6-adenine-methyltransferase
MLNRKERKVKIASIADSRRLAYTGSNNRILSRDSDAWYTPAAYVDAARDVMGEIDFDPFSGEKANETIRATRYLDANHSAFEHQWRRNKREDPLRVWMNPPYSSGIVGRAVDAFLSQWKAGNIAQAVVLTNNATDTRWFSALRQGCAGICFTDHRISFESPDGKRISGNTRGQAFFYFGTQSKAAAFADRFSEFGWCISKTRGWL